MVRRGATRRADIDHYYRVGICRLAHAPRRNTNSFLKRGVHSLILIPPHGHTLPPLSRPRSLPHSPRHGATVAHGPRLLGGPTTLRATEKAASMAQESPTLAACFGVGMRAA